MAVSKISSSVVTRSHAVMAPPASEPRAESTSPVTAEAADTPTNRPTPATSADGRALVFGQGALQQQQLLAQTPTRARNVNGGVELLNDVLRFAGGIRQSRKMTKEWDGVAEQVKNARAQLERHPSMGMLVTQTLSPGDVSVSASPVRHPSSFDVVHPTGTQVMRFWVGVDCPPHLPASVKFYTPERFIKAFDRP